MMCHAVEKMKAKFLDSEQMKELENGGRWRNTKCEMNGWYFVIREPKYHSIFLVIVSLFIFFFVEFFCRMSVCAQHFHLLSKAKRNEYSQSQSNNNNNQPITNIFCMVLWHAHTHAHELIGAAILLSTQFNTTSKRNEWKSKYRKIELREIRCGAAATDGVLACLLIGLIVFGIKIKSPPAFACLSMVQVNNWCIAFWSNLLQRERERE